MAGLPISVFRIAGIIVISYHTQLRTRHLLSVNLRFLIFKVKISLGSEAHACNPSYSGGRNQEDHGSKPAQANSSPDPILKKLITKKGWWSGSRCRS
jgi:hypothetical protein